MKAYRIKIDNYDCEGVYVTNTKEEFFINKDKAEEKVKNFKNNAWTRIREKIEEIEIKE